MIIVMGHLIVDAEQRSAYVEACAEPVRLARATPGCLDFAITADPVEPDRVNVMERWAARDHLEAFRGSGPAPALQHRIREAHVGEFAATALGES